MSSFLSGGILQQDFLTDSLARILTPWNYLSVSPVPFKQQRSTTQSSSGSTRTLLDTPSPRILNLASRDLARTPVLEANTENVLQSTPFEKHFGVSFSPAWLQPLQEVSPVVRASSSQEAVVSSPEDKVPSTPKLLTRKVDSRPDHAMYSSDPDEDAEDELDEDDKIDVTDDDVDGEDEEEEEIYDYLVREDNNFLRRLHSLGPELSPPLCDDAHDDHTSPLRSPCKIRPMYMTLRDYSPVEFEEPDKEGPEMEIEEISPTQSLTPGNFARLKDLPRTPEGSLPTSPLSPLTPLTPLSCSTLRSPAMLSAVVRQATRTLTQKRRLDDDSSFTLTSSPKRQKLSLRIPPRAKITMESSSSSVVTAASTPIFTTRSFPPHIEVSPKFPLFYRRYPISSYFQPPQFSSPFTLLNIRDPGGTYNPPRSVFDLYTPRFVKGKGPGKLGLCPICVEPFERGGENRKNWLAMKFSAFKW